MTDLKTRRNVAIDDETKRRDSQDVMSLMRESTGAEPRVWGASIVGVGSYHYKYASGREGNWGCFGVFDRASKTWFFT